jgi:hypothetical protein
MRIQASLVLFFSALAIAAPADVKKREPQEPEAPEAPETPEIQGL